MPTQTAIHHRWNEIAPEAIGRLIARRFITGDRMTVGHLELKRGASVKEHAHESEEMMCVLKGVLKLKIEGDESILREGEVMQIPGGVPHQVEALEDAAIIDVFSPIRQDWIDKTDTYFSR